MFVAPSSLWTVSPSFNVLIGETRKHTLLVVAEKVILALFEVVEIVIHVGRCFFIPFFKLHIYLSSLNLSGGVKVEGLRSLRPARL